MEWFGSGSEDDIKIQILQYRRVKKQKELYAKQIQLVCTHVTPA
jgi:hypothetical protein